MKNKLKCLTGSAGTGKTTRLREIISTHEGKIAKTATTGLAATHISGTTIHSLTKFSPRDTAEDSMRVSMCLTNPFEEKWERFWVNLSSELRTIDLLIIDEISMMRFDHLEAIDTLFRASNKNEDEPFGGIEVVFSGDFLQLPPVTPKSFGAESPWAFNSYLWRQLEVENLDKVYRQENLEFVEALKKIRLGQCPIEVESYLLQNAGKSSSEIEPLILSAKRLEVERHNFYRLSQISSEIVKIEGNTSGSSKVSEKLLSSCLAPRTLILKEGAQVIALANRFDKGYANGSMGIVTRFIEVEGQIFPVVRFNGSTEETIIEPYRWEREVHGESASYTQIPVCLAYALTIHKSQGMSIDKVTIDFNGIFAPGQAYVGMSRAKSIEGLSIMNWDSSKIFADPEAVKFYETFNERRS